MTTPTIVLDEALLERVVKRIGEQTLDTREAIQEQRYRRYVGGIGPSHLTIDEVEQVACAAATCAVRSVLLELARAGVVSLSGEFAEDSRAMVTDEPKSPRVGRPNVHEGDILHFSRSGQSDRWQLIDRQGRSYASLDDAREAWRLYERFGPASLEFQQHERERATSA